MNLDVPNNLWVQETVSHKRQRYKETEKKASELDLTLISVPIGYKSVISTKINKANHTMIEPRP